MNKTLITLLLIAATVPAVQAQDRIYRCGNEYTNNAQQAKERGCKLVEGGNVTVVQGTRPASTAAPAAGGAAAPSSATSPANAPRVSNNEQKSRDSDARAILESELRKAETRHAELLKEYNNIPMPNQNLSEAEIRQYLAFFRWFDAQPAGSVAAPAAGH